MRYLFTTHPLYGHFHPLVPLARALVESGHEVAFASAPGFCPVIDENGFRCFPVGVDETQQELNARLGVLSPIPGPERAAYMWTHIFAGRWAETSLPDLMQVAEAWQPNAIVREDVEFTGCVAAEALGIPHAAVQVAAHRVQLEELIAPNLDRLRAAVGLAPDTTHEMLHRFLLLSPLPLSFQTAVNPLPPTAHAMQHEGFDASSGDRLPPWVEQLPDVPTVYATLGTVMNRMTEILQAILDALREEPLNVIMTTGRDGNPQAFGEQPAHVHIEHYIPQSLLLPYCDLVIIHGGSGTMRDALKHGLPMVIIPVAGDQHVNAGLCADLGVAEVIAPNRRTAQDIRAATRRVLDEPSYMLRAKQLQAEMLALPPLQHGVALLERLAADKEPILQA